MKRFIQGIFLLLITATLLFSCSTTIKIDSYANNETQKKKFIIRPGNTNVSPNDLQFSEFSKYIIRALQKKNYVSVNSIDAADIIILLDYYMGNGQDHTSIISTPIYLEDKNGNKTVV